MGNNINCYEEKICRDEQRKALIKELKQDIAKVYKEYYKTKFKYTWWFYFLFECYFARFSYTQMGAITGVISEDETHWFYKKWQEVSENSLIFNNEIKKIGCDVSIDYIRDV